MNYKLHKIQVNELESFIQSDFYLNCENAPISILRAKSYQNNPNAEPADKVVYYMTDNDKIIAYRTLFPARLNNKERTKFGWLSGSWTHQKYRRKGLATELLKELIADWSNSILFTNYGEESIKLYEKSGYFIDYESAKTHRFYLKSPLAKKRKGASIKNFFYKLIDVSLNTMIVPLQDYFRSQLSHSDYKLIKELNPSDISLLERQTKQDTFLNNQERLSWVEHFPWIGEKQANYHFTSSEESFHFLKAHQVQNRETKVILYITIVNQILKVHYVFTETQNYFEIAQYIYYLSAKYKVEEIELSDYKTIQALKLFRSFYLYQKEIKQNYYAGNSFYLKHKKTLKHKSHYGNGDKIFT